MKAGLDDPAEMDAILSLLMLAREGTPMNPADPGGIVTLHQRGKEPPGFVNEALPYAVEVVNLWADRVDAKGPVVGGAYQRLDGLEIFQGAYFYDPPTLYIVQLTRMEGQRFWCVENAGTVVTITGALARFSEIRP